MSGLGDNILNFRKLKNYSQIDLAEQLGISSQLLGQYERGRHQPKVDFYQKWKSVFGFDLLEETNVSNTVKEQPSDYLTIRRNHKTKSAHVVNELAKDGVPIYDVPIDAGFLERFQESSYYEPLYFLNIPKLRNCNFGAIISGSSMYPIMKSGTIAICRIVDQLDYFDPGEMYLISTTNGFETVKYVQPGDDADELKLIPHNEKIKPTSIKKG